MRRREFIASLLLAAMMEHAQAQPPGKLVRIGVLMAEPFQPLQSLRQELHRLGYVEGQNLRFEYRFAEHRDDQYPVRTALAKCASEAAGLFGCGGTKVYRGMALFELAKASWRGRECSRWSCTDGFATPAMWRG